MLISICLDCLVTSLLQWLLQNTAALLRMLWPLLLLWARGAASQCGQPGTSSEAHLYLAEEGPSIQEVEPTVHWSSV